MNQNHAHDHHNTEQELIDQALGGLRSGDELVDLLATTQPRPNPVFQSKLEERLLAEHQQRQQYKEEPMQATGSYSHKPTLNLAAPLTLLAAMLALLIGGGLLLFMNQPGNQPSAAPPGAAQIQASATFTPTPLPSATPLAVQPIAPTATPLPTTVPPIGMPPGQSGATPTSPFDLRFEGVAELDMTFSGTPGWMPVQIITAWYDGQQWRYEILVNGVTLQVTEDMLRRGDRPDAAPSPMPPTVAPPLMTATPTLIPVDSGANMVSPDERLVGVVIAQQNIPRGTRIETDMLAMVFWPQSVYDRAIGNASEILQVQPVALIGQYANADIPAYNPVRLGDLIPEAPQ